ncbi:uncharacterized protein FA14DRAFT_180001 [Meira miltonrushii]|uniref:Secreted protein n=1 Tax=Meira miltonrushii TaxID=1280837 RepID=A0A316V6X3_9BASI|nr:uncharacterized protein FA14DRAFT_180001 [Meira miltonrushii]PWN33347.1 hypothetical protein FA14DRAFT_180001 [Meira miltonrushii]
MQLVQLSILLIACLSSVSASSPQPQQNLDSPRSSRTLGQHLDTNSYTAKDHAEALRSTRKSMERHEKGWLHRTDKANFAQAFCCSGSRAKNRQKAHQHHVAIGKHKQTLEGVLNRNTEVGPSSPKTTKTLNHEINQANKKIKKFPEQEQRRIKGNERHDVQQHIIDNGLEGYSSDDSWH